MIRNIFNGSSWIRDFIPITLMGVIIGILLCPQCIFNSEKIDWEPVLVSIVYTYVLGYGCSFILTRYGNFNKDKDPVRQFIKTLFLLAVYTIVTSTLIMFFILLIAYQDIEPIKFSAIYDNIRLPVFIALSISSFFSGIKFLKDWRKEAIRSERLEKEKMATQYESLKNQVNPHFLFNSLNTLTSLVYDNQETAVQYINQMSEVYRYVMDSSHKDLVPLSEELEFLDSYIFLQKIRFGDNLVVNIEVDEVDKEKYILPLALQILIENAIKHNEISSERPLQIRLVGEGSSLKVNNQINRKSTRDPGLGIGLSNIEERYKLISGREVGIREDEQVFEVEIPLIEELS